MPQYIAIDLKSFYASVECVVPNRVEWRKRRTASAGGIHPHTLLLAHPARPPSVVLAFARCKPTLRLPVAPGCFGGLQSECLEHRPVVQWYDDEQLPHLYGRHRQPIGAAYHAGQPPPVVSEHRYAPVVEFVQFERFNLACPRATVVKAMEQLKAALDNHTKWA